MYRSEDDIALLTEFLGVLDQAVAANGLSAGTYLVLRGVDDAGGPVPVTQLAETLSADGEDVAAMLRRLSDDGLVDVKPNGVAITDAGTEKRHATDDAADAAIRDHVLSVPHTATVYGLVASMRGGRFTVDDLLEFIAEGPGPGGDDS